MPEPTAPSFLTGNFMSSSETGYTIIILDSQNGESVNASEYFAFILLVFSDSGFCINISVVLHIFVEIKVCRFWNTEVLP